ncbi:MAG: M56 family metallopeptidase [Oscillospiraceae bacterium]
MIETVISSSVLILAVIAVRFIFRAKMSSRLRYALWGLVLIRLLLPVTLLESGISVMNAVPEANSINQPLFLGRLYTAPLTDARKTDIQKNGEIADTNSFGYSVPSEDGKLVTRYALKTTAADVLKLVWIFGAIVVALWFVIVNLVFYTRLRKCRVAYFGDQNLPLRVYTASCTASPCLFGLFRPAVYITPRATNEEAFPYVYAHEYSHYRHVDHVWALLRGLCLAAYWWNPLIWVAAILSRNDSETACDESAIRLIGEDKRLSYGKTLVHMIAEKPSASGILCSATTMSGGKRAIEKRLLLIIKKPKTYVPVLIAVLLILAVIACCAFTGAKKDKISYVYERWGISLGIPSRYDGKIEFASADKLDDNTYLIAYHIPSKNKGLGGKLFTIVRHRREDFASYNEMISSFGGARHFAEDDEYIYSIEYPSDVQTAQWYWRKNKDGSIDTGMPYLTKEDDIVADFIERNQLSVYVSPDEIFNKRELSSREVEKTYRLYGYTLELLNTDNKTEPYYLTSITLRKNSAMVTYIYDSEVTKLTPAAVPDIIAVTSDGKEFTLQLGLLTSGAMVFEAKNLSFQEINTLKIGDNEIKLNSPRAYPQAEDAFKNGLDRLADMSYSELLAYSVGSDGGYSDGAFSELRKRFLNNPGEFAAHFMMPAYPIGDDYKKSLDTINMDYEATRGFDWSMNQQLLYNVLYYCTPEERNAAISTLSESQYEIIREAADLFKDGAFPMS